MMPEKTESRHICADVMDGLATIEDRSVDLVVCDPPYWKVADEAWDKEQMYLADYAVWVEKWLAEVVRVMKRSGSLFLFGYARNVLPMFHIFEAQPLRFRQIITWDKGVASLAGRATRTHQMFSPVTEHIFFWQFDSRPWIKNILAERQRELGLTAKEINTRLGVAVNGGGVWSLIAGDNKFGCLPSADIWPRAQDVMGLHHIAHEDFYPPFQPAKGVTDVWSISNRVPDRIHPTQKPEAVIERIVVGASRPGDVVLDPFMGSGTTAVVCNRHCRKFVGIERDEAIFTQAQQRCEAVLSGGEAR